KQSSPKLKPPKGSVLAFDSFIRYFSFRLPLCKPNRISARLRSCSVQLRNFQPGNEAGQVHVYNTAAAHLPRFKPATLQEVQRRVRDRDFDPLTRFYVEGDGKVVAYAAFNDNGRLSFPWCLPGYERCAEPLMNAVLQAMRQRGHTKALAAYRDDWPSI